MIVPVGLGPAQTLVLLRKTGSTLTTGPVMKLRVDPMACCSVPRE